MRAWAVGLIAAKEIRSTLRDRRAIVSNLLIPLLLLPAVMVGLPLALGGLFEREAGSVSEVGLAGGSELPPELRAAIEAQGVRLLPVDDAETAVRNGRAPVALAVPEGFGAALGSGASAPLRVVRKSGNLRSEVIAGKLEAAVTGYERELVAARLAQAGLDPGMLEPLALERVDASSEAERSSGQLAWLIPFFIAVWTLTGGQMTAIDATAGEKERGTLEALLVAPVRRVEVVLGKFLATLTFGLSAAVMAIVGYLAGGAALRGAITPRLGADANELVSLMGGSLKVDLGTVLLLLLSALLLASVVAALLLGITLFARSFKEAQSYVAPLSFVMILPALALQFKDLLGLGDRAYLVPILNVMFLMDDVVKGQAEPMAVAVTWGSLLVVIGLLLAFAYANFRREDVIFRT